MTGFGQLVDLSIGGACGTQLEASELPRRDLGICYAFDKLVSAKVCVRTSRPNATREAILSYLRGGRFTWHQESESRIVAVHASPGPKAGRDCASGSPTLVGLQPDLGTSSVPAGTQRRSRAVEGGYCQGLRMSASVGNDESAVWGLFRFLPVVFFAPSGGETYDGAAMRDCVLEESSDLAH